MAFTVRPDEKMYDELAESQVDEISQGEVVRRAVHLWYYVRVVKRGCAVEVVMPDGTREPVKFKEGK